MPMLYDYNKELQILKEKERLLCQENEALKQENEALKQENRALKQENRALYKGIPPLKEKLQDNGQ